MRREGIGHLKISKDSTGNGTRNLPSCGTVPQPTAALASYIYIYIYILFHMHATWAVILTFNRSNNIRLESQIQNHLLMPFSPISSHFLPLGFKNSSLHPVLNFVRILHLMRWAKLHIYTKRQVKSCFLYLNRRLYIHTCIMSLMLKALIDQHMHYVHMLIY
jgi:hypothetical protein